MNQSTTRVRPLHQYTLSNGIRLLLQENHTVGLVAGRIFLKNSGSRWDPREKAGVFNLLSRVITKGTERYNAAQIAENVESLGAALSSDLTNDYFLLGLKCVTADFAEILELAAEILRNPTFPAEQVDLEKKLTLQSILSQREQPFNLAFAQLRENMYDQHPYALSVLGIEESLSSVTSFDLQTLHQDHFRPDNLVVSLSGNIDLQEAISRLENVFGDWKNPPLQPEQLVLPQVPNQPKEDFLFQDSQQSIIMLGYFAPSVFNQDYVPLKLLNTYLGNGLSSRLFVELREKRGLAYDVSAIFPTRLDLSQLILYIGTAPANSQVAQDGLRHEAERLIEKQLSIEELQSAKNKLLGQYALGKQTNSEIAHINGYYEALGLGVNFDTTFTELVKQVSPAMIQDVAIKYITQPYLSIVGPKKN